MPAFLEKIRGLTIPAIRQYHVIRLVERLPFVPDRVRYRLGLVDRPMYAHGVRKAVELAGALGHRGVTVIEFGVGGGAGLLALARHARHHTADTGVAVRVVGFDSAEGLPRPTDFRDLSYAWRAGQYPMTDREALRTRLPSSTELVLGDVAETVPTFLRDQAETLIDHPIGFISFDLDYYSSTMAALTLLRDTDDKHLLPRVTAYFDDVVTIARHTGELAAITDFNREHAAGHISPVNLLRAYLPFAPTWADQVFEYHRNHHPDYNRYEQQRATPGWLP